MLATRVVTALILGGAVTIAVLFLSTPAAAAVLGLLFVAGAWEWSGLARLAPVARAAYVAVVACAMLAAPWWVFRRDVLAAVLGIAVLWWVLALLAVVTYPRKLPLAPVAVAGFAALLPAWAALVHLHSATPFGPELTMTVLVIVWAADVGAYFTGRAVGRVKLAPRVSPGKTWEGVAGGVALAAIAAAAAGIWLSLAAGTLVLIGVATAFVSVLGDLTVSICKRNIGRKDSGRLLPGHGGMLDRIDSLTAAAPVFLLGLLTTGLV